MLVTKELAALLEPLKEFEFSRHYDGAVSRVAAVLQAAGPKEAAKTVRLFRAMFLDYTNDHYLEGTKL